MKSANIDTQGNNVFIFCTFRKFVALLISLLIVFTLVLAFGFIGFFALRRHLLQMRGQLRVVENELPFYLPSPIPTPASPTPSSPTPSSQPSTSTPVSPSLSNSASAPGPSSSSTTTMSPSSRSESNSESSDESGAITFRKNQTNSVGRRLLTEINRLKENFTPKMMKPQRRTRRPQDENVPYQFLNNAFEEVDLN